MSSAVDTLPPPPPASPADTGTASKPSGRHGRPNSKARLPSSPPSCLQLNRLLRAEAQQARHQSLGGLVGHVAGTETWKPGGGGDDELISRTQDRERAGGGAGAVARRPATAGVASTERGVPGQGAPTTDRGVPGQGVPTTDRGVPGQDMSSAWYSVPPSCDSGDTAQARENARLVALRR